MELETGGQNGKHRQGRIAAVRAEWLLINRFQSDESGAVTVDWVVLTAAVVGMAMLTYVGLADNTQAVTDATGAAVLTAQDFLTN